MEEYKRSWCWMLMLDLLTFDDCCGNCLVKPFMHEDESGWYVIEDDTEDDAVFLDLSDS